MNVSSGETLTRFIRYSSYFSVVTNRVKPDAFLPHKKSIDVSVFRISELTDSENSQKTKSGKLGENMFKQKKDQ